MRAMIKTRVSWPPLSFTRVVNDMDTANVINIVYLILLFVLTFFSGVGLAFCFFFSIILINSCISAFCCSRDKWISGSLGSASTVSFGNTGEKKVTSESWLVKMARRDGETWLKMEINGRKNRQN